MRAGTSDSCGCFPTGHHYPGITHLLKVLIRGLIEQFAADSGSRLGDIRSASQGLFQILARDEAPGLQEPYQIAKRLRVVSTVEYFLAD